MVRTNICLTVDSDLKEKAMPIIQNEMKTSLSRFFDEKMAEIIKQKEETKSDSNTR